MNKPASLLTLACIWLFAVVPSSAFGQVPDTVALAQLERVWNQAHLEGNAELLDRLWADDFEVNVPGMVPMSKQQALEFARSARMRFDLYETSDLRYRVYKNAAVVTGRLRRTRHTGGRAVDDDWRFTKVYIRQGADWRVVTFHASPSPF